PLGCLIRCVMLLLTPIVLALWGFDQYLHWQAAQARMGASAASSPVITIRVDFGRPLTALALLMAVVAAMALVRRFAPQQRQRRLYRSLQAAGALVALLQPGLLLGAAITAAVCWERPRPLRYLVRGC